MRVRYLLYLGMSLAGILPRVVLFTILGDKVYDLVPMKYVVAVGAALVVIALIVWIVKYTIKTVNSEEEFGKPAYTPLCEEKRAVILDTNIGPDCDDAGALAIMFEYLKKYDIKLLGICNCTSNICGNAAIRAISEYYGLDEPCVGCHKGAAVLPDNSKYSREIMKKYCKYESSACAADDAADVYLRLLADVPDSSVTVITIGTFTNIASALRKDAVLFNKKVHSIVSMAGKYPSGREFNIETDPVSAAAVLEKFRNLMVFSPYDIGKDIKTGFMTECENNPVYDCYRLHCGGKPPYLNPSFDLTAVQYAFEGNGELYSLSKPMNVTVDMSGEFTAKKDKYSNKRFIIKKGENEDIAAYLGGLLLSRGAAAAEAEPEVTQCEYLFFRILTAPRTT
jgi:inosine-uridine nucleoside N-ribohydrolase